MSVVVNTGDIKTVVTVTDDGHNVNVSTSAGVQTHVNINGAIPIGFPVPGPQGDPGNEIEIVAQENIAVLSVVTTDGKKASSDILSHNNKIAGIAVAAIANAASGMVISFGEITNQGWNWQKGDRIYLNGFVLSNAGPAAGFSVQVASALEATKLLVNIQPSILL